MVFIIVRKKSLAIICSCSVSCHCSTEQTIIEGQQNAKLHYLTDIWLLIYNHQLM